MGYVYINQVGKYAVLQEPGGFDTTGPKSLGWTGELNAATVFSTPTAKKVLGFEQVIAVVKAVEHRTVLLEKSNET